MTTALEGGEWSAPCPGRTLPPGKIRYPFYRRLGGPQGQSGRAENLVPPGFDPRTVHPVAQSLYRLSYPAHNRNEYQENFLGGKSGRCVRLTILPPSCAVVMKSGNLNFLESSGSLQACNGTALHFIEAGLICVNTKAF